MTLAYKAAQLITGTEADRTGGTWTNLSAGWRFQTDLGVRYRWSGTAWINDTASQSIITKTNTDYTLLAADSTVLCDATAGTGMTITLPTAVGATGKPYTIRRIDILQSSNLVHVATTSSQTIGGAPGWHLWPGEFLTVISDNANWQVITHTFPGMSYYHGPNANGRRIVACANAWGSLTTTTTSPAANTLWALPLVIPRVSKFNQIVFVVTTGAVTNARCGIYRDTGNLYPGALIFDTGAVDCTGAATKATTITAGLQVFPPGLYWLAWEVAAATIQIRGIPSNTGLFDFLGYSMSQAIAAYGYSVAHTFGALPDPYTASATLLTTAAGATVPVPAIGLDAL